MNRDERICPFCGKRNDAHQPMPGNNRDDIHEGAVMLCAYCGNIGVATETGVRMPSNSELAEIMQDERVVSIHRFVNERLAPHLARRGN